MSLMLFMHCLPQWQPMNAECYWPYVEWDRNNRLSLNFSHRGELLVSVCTQNTQIVSSQSFVGEQIQTLFTLHFNTRARTHARRCTLTLAHTHTEWICHLIIMRRKILADGEHTEGCNYDPFQRAHAQWQCLHFHPEREREKNSHGMTGKCALHCN